MISEIITITLILLKELTADLHAHMWKRDLNQLSPGGHRALKKVSVLLI
jgi:hypothetical protein